MGEEMVRRKKEKKGEREKEGDKEGWKERSLSTYHYLCEDLNIYKIHLSR